MVTSPPQYTYAFLPAAAGLRTEKDLEDTVEPDDLHDRDVDGTRAGSADTDMSNIREVSDPMPDQKNERRR